MALTAEQERYISAILDKSELELLYEVASGSVQGITASAQQPSPAERMARFQQLLRRVPARPITEYHKPALEIHLDAARKTLETAKARLYRLLCDPNSPKLNGLTMDIFTGDIKEIVMAAASALLSQYGMAVAVGIPASIILLRRGVQRFCATKPTT